MNRDVIVQALRYLGMFLGGIFVARGTITKEQMAYLIEKAPDIVDTVTTTAAALSTAGIAFWGFYTKWNTKAVPADVAAKPSIPTISPITGAVEEPVKK